MVGPDAYRDLPNLIDEVNDGRKAVNVILSKEETYAISPVRLGEMVLQHLYPSQEDVTICVHSALYLSLEERKKR